MAEKTAKNPTGAGRPRLNIDPRIVRRAASVHCTDEEIATLCGCSVDTLTAQFSDLIKELRQNTRESIRKSQIKRALAGSDTMLIWLGKILLHQKEYVTMEHSGPDGKPIQTQTSINIVSQETLNRLGVNEQLAFAGAGLAVAGESRRNGGGDESPSNGNGRH